MDDKNKQDFFLLNKRLWEYHLERLRLTGEGSQLLRKAYYMGFGLKIWAVFAAVAIVCSGCAKRYIPNTDIEDTEKNREIISFCERYRKGVEDLNVGLLLSLASPRYFDNSGTMTGDDDMDKTGLEAILKNKFKTIKTMRHEIRYRDIYEQDNVIFVVYYYTSSYEYEVDGTTKWGNKTADNRLELERVENGFLIVSGM